ncbi:LCP family protein [Clostridium sp. JN-9]|uniref:LCP family protein n=1 Tax=Clostridium sp. JN-9 TaxID=2507159 RepID=UPI000FFE317E|nr:LCP family protein [Clostridium sp. JN-9]QAT40514.1 LytR family transcriptional regulator [Clostridium sp. JN-9]
MFKKKSTKFKVIISIITVVLAFLVVGTSYIYMELNKVKKVEIPKTSKELNISPKAETYDNSITNIAFYGLDRRAKDEASRSDAIIIVSIDKQHKKIKLSSVMRDSYVNVEGHGMTKITHAYAYGGPQLAIKTLNQNFDLNIKDFVTVDFFDLEKIIDAVGGIDLNITNEELKYINSYITETSKIEKSDIPAITKAGVQHVNGRQAVAYTRIRYTAGGDFERTTRQRTVLTSLLNEIMKTSVSNLPNVVNNLAQYTETSLSSTEMIKMATSVAASGIHDIVQERFPVDGYCNALTKDGVWYLQLDLNATKDQLYKFIYEDIKPVPGTPKF